MNVDFLISHKYHKLTVLVKNTDKFICVATGIEVMPQVFVKFCNIIAVNTHLSILKLWFQVSAEK